MKKSIITIVMLLLIASSANAQVSAPWVPGRLFVFSNVINIVNGPNTGDLWLDAGAGYRIIQFENGVIISGVVRALHIEGQKPNSVGFYGIVVDPIGKILGKQLDILYEVGGQNELVIDGEKRKWGLVTGTALNWHVGVISSIMVGGKVFQNSPGKINGAGVGGGVVIYNVDDLLGKLF